MLLHRPRKPFGHGWSQEWAAGKNFDKGRAPSCEVAVLFSKAAIAQLGERQTEDLKVPGSIPGLGIFRQSIVCVFSRAVHSWAQLHACSGAMR